MALQDVIKIPPEERNRESGIPAVGAAPWGTHLCCFYDTKQDLIDILVPYFKAGLENNESCIWVTSETLGVKEAEEAVTKAMPDFAQYLERGQIEIIPYTEWYLKGGAFNGQRVLNAWIDKLDRATANGYDGMRLTGNTSWLGKRHWRKFTDYEEEVNNVIGKYHMLAICTYSLGKYGASQITDVVSNHQAALIRQAGKWVLIESSEHKRAVETLQESEKKYRSLFENMLNSFAYCKILVDENNKPIDYVHLEVNDAWERTIGLKKEDVIGKKITEVIPGIKESKTDLISIYGKVALTGEGTKFELYFEPLGKWFTVSVYSPKKGYFITVFENITERKRAEEETEKLLKTIETAGEAISIISPELVIGYTNESMDKLFGYEKGELIGKHVSICNAEPVSEVVAKQIANALEKEGWWEGEIHNKRKDGTEFISYARTSGLRDKDGKVVNFLSTQHDITERKRAEETLRGSEEQHCAIFEQAAESIVLVDADTGALVEFNNKAHESLGYTRQEFEKLKIPDFEIIESVEEVARHIEKIVKEGSDVFETKHRTKSGEIRDIQVSSKAISIRGKKYVQSIWRDITERKQAGRSQEMTSPAQSGGQEPLTPLQTRFVKSGLEGFSERKVIELLLSLCPSGRQSQIRERASKAFKNVRELLSASPQELQQAGLPPLAITYIRLLHDIPVKVLREKIVERLVYASSQEIFDYLYYSMRDLKKEVFKVIYLNKRDQIIDVIDLFEGTLDIIPIRPREIVDSAIKHNASFLIFVHNHPTGDPSPSKTDKRLTRDLVFIGNILQIRVLDHIIIGEDRYFSFADDGLIQKYEDEFLNIRIRRI